LPGGHVSQQQSPELGFFPNGEAVDGRQPLAAALGGNGLLPERLGRLAILLKARC
jgi:hypothetical protein